MIYWGHESWVFIFLRRGSWQEVWSKLFSLEDIYTTHTHTSWIILTLHKQTQLSTLTTTSASYGPNMSQRFEPLESRFQKSRLEVRHETQEMRALLQKQKKVQLRRPKHWLRLEIRGNSQHGHKMLNLITTIFDTDPQWYAMVSIRKRMVRPSVLPFEVLLKELGAEEAIQQVSGSSEDGDF